MQTLNISLPRIERQNEPGGSARNVFRLGRALMETDRADNRHPFPELFWLEREMPAEGQDLRGNLWQSYNAAASNIRGARILTQAAANHLTETQLMLTLVHTMLDEAVESADTGFRNEVVGQVARMFENIDASFDGLARVFERSSAVYVNGSDSFIAQVGIHSNQVREVEMRQINTRTLGLSNGNADFDFENMRSRVENALSELRKERMHIFGANSALDADRSALDLNVWGNDAVQPGTINPPLGDDATDAERVQRAEAERVMRMSILRREVTNLRTLFEMIELFRGEN